VQITLHGLVQITLHGLVQITLHGLVYLETYLYETQKNNVALAGIRTTEELVKYSLLKCKRCIRCCIYLEKKVPGIRHGYLFAIVSLRNGFINTNVNPIYNFKLFKKKCVNVVYVSVNETVF
jgi:hypothetical protein